MAGARGGFVSVVAPLSNAEKYVAGFARDCLAVLAENYRDYELILVDDASADATAGEDGALLAGCPQLRLVRLSRRFGLDVASVAGLDTAIGDYVVLMRPECDPPAEIPAMVGRAAAGWGVVTGVDARYHKRPDGWTTYSFRRAFHGYSNRVLGLNYPPYGTTFQVLSRAAATAASRSRPKRPTFPLLASQVGFGGDTHPYFPARRDGAPPADGLFTKLDRGLTVLSNTTVAPLRGVAYVGLAAAALNALYALYVVGVALFKPHVAEGWTTLSLQLSGMFFFLFLLLVVMCEYVGRTLVEVIDRPLYHVAEERGGSALLPMDGRRNIEEKSA